MMKKIQLIVLLTVILPLIMGCKNSNDTDDNEKAPVYSYNIINIYPHDQLAFTQGLVFYNGFLYESTGNYGRSSLRKVDLETGSVLQQCVLSNNYFGEGLTVCQDKMVQLTWRSKTGFVYNIDSLNIIDQFNYPTQGWGITYDGTHLIMSDGSSKLYFLDPVTFERIKQIQVKDGENAIDYINELEFFNNSIYANIWQSDRIAQISPQTGAVIAWIDLTGLLDGQSLDFTPDVLNGIAYDVTGDRLFVTGKYWPVLFEIEIVAR